VRFSDSARRRDVQVLPILATCNVSSGAKPLAPKGKRLTPFRVHHALPYMRRITAIAMELLKENPADTLPLAGSAEDRSEATF
jgi:hypothetical protein